MNHERVRILSRKTNSSGWRGLVLGLDDRQMVFVLRVEDDIERGFVPRVEDGGQIWVRLKQLKESTKGSEESKTSDDGNMMMMQGRKLFEIDADVVVDIIVDADVIVC